MSEEIKEEVEANKELTEEQEKQLKNAEELEKKAENSLKFTQKKVDLVIELAKKEGDNLSINQAQTELAKKALDFEKAKLDALTAQLANSKNITADQENQLKALRDSVGAAQAFYEQSDEIEKATQGIREQVSSTLNGILGSTDASKSFAGQLLTASKGAGGISTAISQIGKGIGDSLTPANLLLNVFEKVQEATFAGVVQFDALRAELVKAGASLEKYSDQIESVRESSISAGVGIRAVSESILALQTNMSAFNTLSGQNREELLKQTAVLSKLGIGADVVASNMDFLSRAMNMSSEEITNVNSQIAATADALGVSVAGALEDFAASAPALASRGRESINVFRELQTQAKATGIAIGDLIGLVSTFDTFQGASEATAMLNATMGTTLNSLELLNASESERIRLLTDSLDATGRSFESMSRFERMQAAQVLTGGDVEKLQRLMNANLYENASAAELAAMKQEDLAKKSLGASTATEKLIIMSEQFGIALMPLVDIMSSFLNVLIEVNQSLGGFLIPLLASIAIGTSLIKVISSLSAVKSIAAAVTSSLTAAQAAQNATNSAGIPITRAAGAAARASVGSTLALGAAMGLLGAGIGLAAFGMSALADSFSKLNEEQLDALLITFAGLGVAVLALGAIMLSPLGQAAGLGALALGGAFLLLGAGVALVSVGLAQLAPSLNSIFSIFSAEIGSALAMVAAFSALTTGVTGLGLALLGIKTDDLQAVADIVQGMGEINQPSAIALQGAMIETKNTVEAMAAAPEQVQVLKETFMAASNVPATVAAPVATAPSSAGPTTVILKLKERELGRFVLDEVRNGINIQTKGG